MLLKLISWSQCSWRTSQQPARDMVARVLKSGRDVGLPSPQSR